MTILEQREQIIPFKYSQFTTQSMIKTAYPSYRNNCSNHKMAIHIKKTIINNNRKQRKIAVSFKTTNFNKNINYN